MEASHKDRNTLDGKEPRLKVRFSFQTPIPIPLDGGSAIKTSHNDETTQDDKGEPLDLFLEELFSLQSLSLDSSSKMETPHKDRITQDEEGQPLVGRHCIENNSFKVFAELSLNEDEEHGSSVRPQRLRTVHPVPYRTAGKRHSELEESDEEPSSKRFRFKPPISLHLDDSSPMQSGGRDAADKDEDLVAAKQAGTGEKIRDIKEAKVSPPLKASSVVPQPSGLSHQDSPIDRSLRLRRDDTNGASPVPKPQRHRQKHKPVLEIIEEEGALDIPRRSSRLRSVQSTSSPKTVPSVPPESKQSRESSQLSDNISNQNREFRLHQHRI